METNDLGQKMVDTAAILMETATALAGWAENSENLATFAENEHRSCILALARENYKELAQDLIHAGHVLNPKVDARRVVEIADQALAQQEASNAAKVAEARERIAEIKKEYGLG